MGWWVPKPALMRDEVMQWSVGANREQSANRQVGGRLFVTSARLLFEPHRVDSLSGGKRWSVRLGNVQAVDVAAAGTTGLRPWNAAGLRRRLKVVDAKGEVDLFVVNHVNAVVERLNEALAEATDPVAGA